MQPAQNPLNDSSLDVPAPVYGIGQCSVTRVTERTIDSFTPSFLFPSATAGQVEAHSVPLGPGCMSQAGAMLLLSIHTWVLRVGERTILIDTGVGNHKERPGKAVFHQLNTDYMGRLMAAGVDPDRVDLVLNTHLHTDHVGWNTRLVNGVWRPSFKNARYMFPQHELDLVRNHPGHLGQIYADSVKPVIDAGLAITVPSEGQDIGDGLSFVATPGHTAGHMSIWLRSGPDLALFSGDVMHHPLQVYEPALNSVFCDFAEDAVSTRQRILAEVADRRAVYFSSHFPESSAGLITRTGAGFAWRSL